MVTVEYTSQSWSIGKMYPESQVLDRAIPERAREYLAQAIDTLHSPAASVVVAASSVDAMLQAKNYRDGSLYTRINQAAADHLITQDMAHWAHEIRLEANAQRHADQAVPLPGQEDARRSIEFAKALAQFLFVLPELVAKGRGSH